MLNGYRQGETCKIKAEKVSPPEQRSSPSTLPFHTSINPEYSKHCKSLQVRLGQVGVGQVSSIQFHSIHLSITSQIMVLVRLGLGQVSLGQVSSSIYLCVLNTTSRIAIMVQVRLGKLHPLPHTSVNLEYPQYPNCNRGIGQVRLRLG